MYIFLSVLPSGIFFRARRGIRIALLMYRGISVYAVRTSRAVRVIWDVYLMLLSCPCLGCYLWDSINNRAQPVGGVGEDDFPLPFTPFSSFRPVSMAFEKF